MARTAPISLALSVLMTTAALSQSVPQSDNAWFSSGQETLTQKLAQSPNTNRAKNVILMLAGGNGVGTNYATRLFHGQQSGGFGEETVLPHEDFPHIALSKTYNVNAQTPDAAGSGTATS